MNLIRTKSIEKGWRRVVCLAINSGISIPGMSSSLDYFGAYTYERIDGMGSFHTR
ncbi:putative phosphogluconate dehydrogenase (NADP(+)-dependent, decarboxylating) [Helianthus annuus]|nr:putative phosphogluconate dehydrogenase (NADP(+)-dependent, decarboxylating) [Helianthus annuus]